MKILAVHDLEKMVEQGCMMPGCTHTEHTEVFLTQRCHPGAGLSVRYEKASGVLNLYCKRCDHPVANVSVGLVS